MSIDLGMLVAGLVKQQVREAKEEIMASVATFGVAASDPTADPDGSGRNVVDVAEGSVIWPGLVVRSGETITNGDAVIILKLGQRHKAGWLVMRA